MKFTAQQLAEINEKIDMHALIDSHGFETRQENGQRLKIRCPFHPGDNDPSLLVYLDRRPHSWYCFGCKEGGDPLEFIRLLTGKSFGRVVEKYADPNRIFTVEDQVRMILDVGKKYTEKARLQSIVESGRLSLAIKARTLLRKNKNDDSKMLVLHSVLQNVDDFAESDTWAEWSEFDIKDFFRKSERELKNV